MCHIEGVGKKALRYICQCNNCNEVVDYRVREGVIIICDDFYDGYETDYDFIGFRLPNSVISIGKGAFQCYSLKHMALPNSVLHIGEYGFSYCHSLKTFTIPSSVKKIESNILYGCENLNKIIVSQDNEYYCSLDGVLYNKDCTELIFYPTKRQKSYYEVPRTVKRICKNAFFDCKTLKIISLSESVSLIEEEAFRGCDSLQDILVDDNNEFYTSSEGILFNKDCSELIKCPSGKQIQSYDIPFTVSIIRGHAFDNCQSIQAISISPSVTKIEGSAFKDCKSLYSLKIPSSVKVIENSVVWGCTLLQSITIFIPSIVEKVNRNCFCKIGSDLYDPGEYTFSIGYNNTFSNQLKYANVILEVPSSVISIDYETFSVDEKYYSVLDHSLGVLVFNSYFWLLRAVVVDEENEQFVSIDGVLFNKDCTELIIYPCKKQASSYTIPSSVRKIWKGAFLGCKSLENIYVPQSDIDRFMAMMPDYAKKIKPISH